MDVTGPNQLVRVWKMGMNGPNQLGRVWQIALIVGGGVKGVRPAWLEKRKKLQIHWTRRGWSHKLGSRHGGVEARRSRRSSHESIGGIFNQRWAVCKSKAMEAWSSR